MKVENVFDPVKIADRIRQHLQDAVGDVASDMLNPNGGMVDDKWKAKIRTAKKARVQDLVGWLADELYSDPDMISDLIGDQIHEACNSEPAKIHRVLDELSNKGRGTSALAVACVMLRPR